MKVYQVQTPAEGGPIGNGRFVSRERAVWYRDQLLRRGWPAVVVETEV